MSLRLPRARARRRGQLLRRRQAHPSTRSRCTRSPTPSGSRSTCWRSGRRRTRTTRSPRTARLHIVVVGGGPTGVESAGALAELYHNTFAEDYPDVSKEHARITLVEASPQLFGMFKEKLREYTKKTLEEYGVEVLPRRDRRVRRADAGEAQVREGAGGAHAGLGRRSAGEPDRGATSGVELERGNRVAAEPDLSLAGHPEVFAVGDIAWITDTKTDEVLPQLGSVALQAGEQAGENIARLVAGKETKPFAYHDKGTMATIGRGAAVVQLAARSDDEGRASVSRLGRGPPGAALDRRGPSEGARQLDLGGVHATSGPPGSASRPNRTRRR